jgi:hypothetical protein
LNSLLVLDEIDHVLTATHSNSTSHQNLLNSLFGLAHAPNSPLTIIGIANALDLTTRSLHLTRLSTSTQDKSSKGKGKAIVHDDDDEGGPVLLHFEPYKAGDIRDIIKQRLSLLVDSYPYDPTSTPTSTATMITSALPLLNPAALELCTRKVERATGDIRTSLEIVRNAIGMIKRIELAKVSNSPAFAESSPLSTPTKPVQSKIDLLSHFTPLTAPKASFPQIMKAITLAGLNTPDTLATKLAALNFSARNALVGVVIALSRMEDNKPGKGFAMVEIREAFEVYKEVINNDGTINALSRADFRGTVELSLDSFITLSSPTRSSPGKLSNTSHASRGGGGGGRVKPRLKRNNTVDNSAAEPLISLPSSLSLPALIDALKTTPSTNPESTTIKTSKGALEETLRISINLLNFEERRKEGRKRVRGKDELAPSAGFHGDGLEMNGGKEWMGEKKRKVEKMDDDEAEGI